MLRGFQPFLVMLLFMVSGATLAGARQATDRTVHISLDGTTGVATSRLAGRYPIYQVNGAAWHLKVDGERGRVIVAARFWGLNPNVSGSSERYNLLVPSQVGLYRDLHGQMLPTGSSVLNPCYLPVLHRGIPLARLGPAVWLWCAGVPASLRGLSGLP